MQAQVTTEKAVCLIMWGRVHFTSVIGSSWAQHNSSHHPKPREHSGHQEHYETREPALRSGPRTEIPSCIRVATEHSWTNFAPSATVGIPPTAASWTNAPPPHLSIHWDDHITGMITSTSWDDHITGMITSTHKNAKLWIAYFLCATRHCRVLSML